MLGINAITITPKILNQISDIDEFKGLWIGLEQHTTALNLLGDVADYGSKFQTVIDALRGRPLTPEIIKSIHAGEKIFKSQTNTLSIGEKDRAAFAEASAPEPVGTLETANVEQVEPLLEKLCEWVNESLETKELHPLLIAAVFASVFLQIAPFENGNQQSVRFLIVVILMKAGYAYAPYVSLANIMNEKAEEFYAALKHNQHSLENGRPDWSQWISFFLGVLQAQKEILETRLNADKTDLQNLPALSVKIMDLFKTHQRLQMKEIIKLTRGRRATIKLRLSELLEAGYLKRHGQARATWYSLV